MDHKLLIVHLETELLGSIDTIASSFNSIIWYCNHVKWFSYYQVHIVMDGPRGLGVGLSEL